MSVFSIVICASSISISKVPCLIVAHWLVSGITIFIWPQNSWKKLVFPKQQRWWAKMNSVRSFSLGRNENVWYSALPSWQLQTAGVCHVANHCWDRWFWVNATDSFKQNRANRTAQFGVVHSQLVCSAVRSFGVRLFSAYRKTKMA